jgi:hypothetical protein
VRVERHRAGALDAANTLAMRGRKHGSRAMRAVHMKPHAVFVAEIGDGLQVVERTRGRGARRGDDRHDAPAFAPHRLERLPERDGIELELAGAHRQHAAHADAQLAGGARHRVVRVFAAEKRRRILPDALRP